MHPSNPSLVLQAHLFNMPTSTSALTSTALVSSRLGVSNMDGQPILAGLAKSYARPWTGLIPISELTKDNLPPFYVRLQDAQVGHLANWLSTCRSSITRRQVGQYWPWDFDAGGRIISRRDNWGAEYDGEWKEKGKGLGGAKKVPTWTDAKLPLTYTSSHKIMAGEIEAPKAGTTLKRKAEEEAGRNACMPVKKPRLRNMSVELERMKECVAQKCQNQKWTERGTGKERYANAKPELRDAVAVVDTLMRNATETEDRNAKLEAMLLANEAKYAKDTDDMFDEWLTYNEVKRIEVERILESHVVDIRSRDVKIETLTKKAKGFRARLDKAKKKIRVRDERLARVKTYWADEQASVEKKLREIEEGAVDLDELSEFNHDSDDEFDDEDEDEEEEEEEEEEAEYNEDEPVKAEDVIMCDPNPKPAEAKEAKEPKIEKANEPNSKEPMGRGLAESIGREKGKSVSEMDVVNLIEDEDDEDEEDEDKRSTPF